MTNNTLGHEKHRKALRCQKNIDIFLTVVVNDLLFMG
jgi:hypothetical protein